MCAFRTWDGDGLRNLPGVRGLDVGTAVRYDALKNDSEYRRILSREYSVIVAENEFKFSELMRDSITRREIIPDDIYHLTPEDYDFSRADEICEFARDNNMKVRGHTLVWWNQVPSWLANTTWEKDQLLKVMEDHITIVISHFKEKFNGIVYAWDVANEYNAFGQYPKEPPDPTEPPTINWVEKAGYDYIGKAFSWASNADPNALLFYNDFNIELGDNQNQKQAQVYEMLRSMIQDYTIPIHGIGLQAHGVEFDESVNALELYNAINKFGALGLQVHITELFIKSYNISQQASAYRYITQVCRDNHYCTAFVTWGFTDRYCWVPKNSEGEGYEVALPYDDNLVPKPAYHAISEVLSNKKICSIPAEHMLIHETGEHIDGVGWNIWANGKISSNVVFHIEGTYNIDIFAGGTSAQGIYPIMQLLIDDISISNTTVSDHLAYYRNSVYVVAGTHKISVEFLNDLRTPNEDRNLYINNITITFSKARCVCFCLSTVLSYWRKMIKILKY